MVNIAFIGLGNMGGPMAANLAKQVDGLVVHDAANEARDDAPDIHRADGRARRRGDAREPRGVERPKAAG